MFYLNVFICRHRNKLLNNTKCGIKCSQGNEALFAAKQCVAMPLLWFIIKKNSEWTSSTLNNILPIGNNPICFYKIFCAGNWFFLLLTDVPCVVSRYNKVYTLQYSESLTGWLFMTPNNGQNMSLQNSLREVLSNSGLNHNCWLLTVGINTVAVFKNPEQRL